MSGLQIRLSAQQMFCGHRTFKCPKRLSCLTPCHIVAEFLENCSVRWGEGVLGKSQDDIWGAQWLFSN